MLTSQEAPRQTVSGPTISLPKGGGAIQGIGETFEPSAFSGTGQLTLPLPLTEARGLTPELALRYDSGHGNGPFGLGFSLDVPTISRRTDKGIPRYDDQDTFLLTGADPLVPELAEHAPGDWRPVVLQEERDGVAYRVHRYRPRTEGAFARIERWTPSDGNDSTVPGQGSPHWRVTDADGTHHVFGRSASARISEPDDRRRIYQWNLEESRDPRGNRVVYEYRREDDWNVPSGGNEATRSHTAGLYPHRVLYGNYATTAGERFGFQVLFDYGDYDPEAADLHPDRPARPWPARDDPFSIYRPGFELRTHRLCRSVVLFHHFDELGPEPVRVRATHLTYGESNHLARITEVRVAGYRKTDDERLESESLPPLALSWSAFEPTSQRFRPLSVEGRPLPGYADGGRYQPVDLYGEGLPGLLYTDRATALYFAPLGDGRYAPAAAPETFPVTRDLASAGLSLMDLGGDGALDLVVQSPRACGYHSMRPDRGWDGFRAFESWPLDGFDPERDLADLDGDGRADLLVDAGETYRAYPSRGKAGFAPARRAPLPSGFPARRTGSREEVVAFADMFGDGLDHRVRVRDGVVECWPNLGHGRFGAAVRFDDAPRFSSRLDARRLRFADVDGSGTADLIYLRSDVVEIFFNLGGHRFSEPLRLPLPERFDDLDRIHLADVLGDGTTCLVLTHEGPQRHHTFYAFSDGKPHLLIGTDNHMGAVTRVHYRSSTHFYLQDRAAGRAWRTKLPFPVQVVEKIESIDPITGSQQVARYAFHHGHYDGREREFRGFGLVERWDTENFESGGTDDLSGVTPLHAMPAYTRTWYHTGAFLRAEIVSRHDVDEYYAGDPQAPRLPDSVFEPTVDADDLDDTESLQDAYRALHGQVLREEVYGLDGERHPQHAPHPYTVRERNVTLRRVQPKGPNRYAVFLTLERETLDVVYERDPSDPRVSHSLILEHDDVGQPRWSCAVAYPRRQAEHAEQARTWVTLQEIELAHTTEPFYRLNVPTGSRSYELAVTPRGALFGFDELHAAVEAARVEPLPYSQAVTPGRARLLSWQRMFYWQNARIRGDASTWDDARIQKEAQDGLLPHGEVGERALLHHTESAEVPVAMLESLMSGPRQGRMTPEELRQTMASKGEAGGALLERDGYWWNLGTTTCYRGAEGFYLPCATIDPTGAVRRFGYDDYALQLRRSVDALGNTVRANLDYRTLQVTREVDANDNVSEVVFDALGRVRASSVYGTEQGQRRGDAPLTERLDQQPKNMAQALADPHRWLQSTTAWFFYDAFAWRDRREPPQALSITREVHSSELEPGKRSPLRVSIAYGDGRSRALQTKLKVEPGPARRLTIGGAETVETDDRWLVSGRVVRDHKDQPVKRYSPWFGVGPGFVSERALTDHGVRSTYHYDPLGRALRTDLPNGFFSKVEPRAWEVRSFDANDTVEDASAATIAAWEDDPDRQDALAKARAHAGTPSVEVLDGLGRTTRTLAYVERDGEPRVTEITLDVQGRTTSMTDPRLLASSQGPNSRLTYSMSGRVLERQSVDSGPGGSLFNAAGDLIRHWDGRGVLTIVGYDPLGRPTWKRVRGLGLDHTVERVVYGEQAAGAKASNLRQQPLRSFGPEGVTHHDLYSFRGEPLAERQVLRRDFEGLPDWSTPEREDLEGEVWETQQRFDALGRVVHRTLPDGVVVQPTYLPSGHLGSVRAVDGKRTIPVVRSLSYDARGQRLSIDRGNGVRTEYAYDPRTFILESVRSGTADDPARLQDLRFTVDPVANITRLRDRSHERVFGANQVVNPVRDYTYDALYRLTRATGRTHPGSSSGERRPEGQRPDASGPPLPLPPGRNDAQALRNYTRHYTYDTGGNLVRIRQQGATPFTREIPASETSNRAAGDGVEHDAAGNRLSLPHLRGLHWDYRNALARVDLVVRQDQPSDTEHYVYDAEGTRVRKVTRRFVGGGRVRLDEVLYLGDFEVRRTRFEGGPVKREVRSVHISDDTGRVATLHRVQAGARRGEARSRVIYNLDDQLGSATLELDEQGRVITYEEYFPYGGTALVAGRSATDVSDKAYRFMGKERDAATGLYHYGLRTYAPWLGRWLSADPLGSVDGPNLYAFVGGNPISWRDESGGVRVPSGVGIPSGVSRIRRRQLIPDRYDYDSDGLSEMDLDSDPRAGLSRSARVRRHLSRRTTQLVRSSGTRRSAQVLDPPTAVRRIARSIRRMRRRSASSTDHDPIVVDFGDEQVELAPTAWRRDVGAYALSRIDSGGYRRSGGARTYESLGRALDQVTRSDSTTPAEVSHVIRQRLLGNTPAGLSPALRRLTAEAAGILLTDMARGSAGPELVSGMLDNSSTFHERFRQGGLYPPASRGGSQFIQTWTQQRRAEHVRAWSRSLMRRWRRLRAARAAQRSITQPGSQHAH